MVRGGDIRRSEEAMGKDFINALEGCIGNGALRGIGEVRKKDRVCNDNRVRRFNTFGNSNSVLAEGDRDRRLGDIWDEGLHQR